MTLLGTLLRIEHTVLSCGANAGRIDGVQLVQETVDHLVPFGGELSRCREVRIIDQVHANHGTRRAGQNHE